MKLFLVLIVLLSQVLTAWAKPPRCFNNVAGYCKKKCKMGEISEMGCLHGKLCGVNEEENKKYHKSHQPPPQSDQKVAEVYDYVIYPTVTLVSIL
ncbi:Beta-defensin 128 [Heterocephalus glaber]|uniref:Beta-defensin 128 n=1 Tax=Heterocephalus glaber TaxID=10181 RepID=G5C6L7_HETGA|nr:beta-defensin 128 [Heterocephalus glaber]EHB17178.1 Beta-defensin 128 [Heterocephalus glaber]